MWKVAAAGVIALLVGMSPVANAQSYERLSPSDWNALTDFRTDLVKTALQLTPDQAKYWPAVEEAIRARAKNRQARVEKITETAGRRAGDSLIQVLRNRDPVNFLNRRADALAQRAADLKRLADAWQPLYQTLTPEQKRRMAALAIFALREMRDGVEQRSLDEEDDD